MIRTIRPLGRPDPGLERVAKANGFSLRAGVSCEGHQKDKRDNTGAGSPAECHAARACPAVSGMTWAQRRKRVFNIDIEVCGHCGGAVRVIACIEDQEAIPDKAGQALDRIPTSDR